MQIEHVSLDQLLLFLLLLAIGIGCAYGGYRKTTQQNPEARTALSGDGKWNW
ncbi:MAG: hypothetical protein WBM41_02260 [Arenicellales bacterium]|jgi:hypothetical protein